MGLCQGEIKILVRNANRGEGLLEKLADIVHEIAYKWKGVAIVPFERFPMWIEVFHFDGQSKEDDYFRLHFLSEGPHGDEEFLSTALKDAIRTRFIHANHLQTNGEANIIEVSFKEIDFDEEDMKKALDAIRDQIEGGNSSLPTLFDHSGLKGDLEESGGMTLFLELLTYLTRQGMVKLVWNDTRPE